MEIISRLQNEILDAFTGVPESEHFYLTGGTALSYFYLKHRRSDDLDFFTANEEAILPFSYHLEEVLKHKKIDIQRQRGVRSFVELIAKKDNDITIIHLACDAAFRLSKTEEFPAHPGLKIDSLLDIAANKLLALFGRATIRDFIDVYFLVKKGNFTPEGLMEKAKIKDPGFDLYWLGVALERINTFKDGSPELLLLGDAMDFKDVLLFFNKWREKITKELI